MVVLAAAFTDETREVSVLVDVLADLFPQPVESTVNNFHIVKLILYSSRNS